MQVSTLKQKVNTLKKNIFKKSSSNFLGIYTSKNKGFGLQFKEHKLYDYGDDVRFIDWKLYAKTGIPYVKMFEEERNVVIEYIIDLNNNLFLSHNKNFKIDAICEIFAFVSLLADKYLDKIKLTIIYENIYKYPALNGKQALLKFINLLEELKIMNSDGSWNIDNFIINNTSNIPNFSCIKSIILKAKSKKHPIFFFLSNIINYDSIQKYLTYKNIHLFMLTSPLEQNSKMPYSLKVQSSKTKFLQKTLLNNTSNQQSKKIKIIQLEKNYIHSFIKYVI